MGRPAVSHIYATENVTKPVDSPLGAYTSRRWVPFERRPMGMSFSRKSLSRRACGLAFQPVAWVADEESRSAPTEISTMRNIQPVGEPVSGTPYVGDRTSP